MKWPIAIRRRADDDGAALAEQAVGKQAAEDRRQIHEAGVEAVDLRRQGLHASGPNTASSALLKRGEARRRRRACAGSSRYLTM